MGVTQIGLDRMWMRRPRITLMRRKIHQRSSYLVKMISMDLDMPGRWDFMRAWGPMNRKHKALKDHDLRVCPVVNFGFAIAYIGSSGGFGLGALNDADDDDLDVYDHAIGHGRSRHAFDISDMHDEERVATGSKSSGRTVPTPSVCSALC